MITTLLVVGILVFLIVVHELGHFFAAKIFGVRVEEFGVGYPPRAFRFGKIGDTEYTLNWIPFGGFVRLFGDIGENTRERGSFAGSSRGVQAIVLIAGVAANAIGAWALFVFAFHVGVPRPVESIAVGEVAALVVLNVVSGSPAEAAGIRAGDEITNIRGESDMEQAINSLTPEFVSEFVRSRAGKPISISYQRAGEERKTIVSPAHGVIPEETGRPALGVALVLVGVQPLPWDEAGKEAFFATKNAFMTVVGGLKGILGRALSGAPSLSDVVGPIGLVGAVGDAARTGAGQVLALAAFISVNLAIINLIPVPALDGGRLLLLALEALLRRSVSHLAVQMLNALGVALIIFLMVAVTYQDIARLVS